MPVIRRTLIALALAAGWALAQTGGKAPAAPALILTSPAFADGTDIPAKYTQAAGAAVMSPKLEWTNTPANAQTFALLMHDPDVSKNKTIDDQTHWIIWNIPASAKELPENVPASIKLPDGTVQGRNAGDTVGYRGP